MRNQKVRSLVLTAILIAIMLLFGFTPIGYIPLPFVKITLMCLPVIIGTLVLGLRTGLGLSLLFILTSVIQLFAAPDAVSLLVFHNNDQNGWMYLLCLSIPRLMIPVTTWLADSLVRRKWEKASLFVASAAGSLTNTALYLALFTAFFLPILPQVLAVEASGVAAVVWGIVLTNGVPEAIVAAAACPFIVRALRKTVPEIVPAPKNAPAAE